MPAAGTADHGRALSAFYSGTAGLEVGNDAHADQALARAIQLAPGEPGAWLNWGILALRHREYDTARSRFETALALRPDSSTMHEHLALAHLGRGDETAARVALAKAIALDSSNLTARYALAELSEAAGDVAGLGEAERLYRDIAGQQPANLVVALDLARLAARRGDAAELGAIVARLSAGSEAWPVDVQRQIEALRQAAVRDAGTRLTFLRNVLLRTPDYQADLAAVKRPPDVIGALVSAPLVIPVPASEAAAPDLALRFEVVTAAAGAAPVVWTGWFARGDESAAVPAMVDERGIAAGPSRLAVAGVPDAVALVTASPVALVDLNDDYRIDVAIATTQGVRLLRQSETGTLVDVTGAAHLPRAATAGIVGLWPADVDQDGDLDLVAARRDGAPRVLRNNSDGTFAAIEPFAAVGALRDFAWVDLDEDGDNDAVMAVASGPPVVLRNDRGGQFTAWNPVPGLGPVAAVAAADMNGDARLDLVVLGADGAVHRIERDTGREAWVSEPLVRWPDAASFAPAAASLVIADLDNNGRADLVVTGSAGSRAWLAGSAGGALTPVTIAGDVRVLDAADGDGDGRLDLVALDQHRRPVVLSNRGTKGYHWQRVRPRAAQSAGDARINAFGVGGTMTLRAGRLTQTAALTGPVVHFGLGEQAATDVVRVVWPNGTVNAEFELSADSTIAAVQRLKGSCPHLFAWNGTAMAYVKDSPPWSPALGLRINAQQTAGVLETEEWFKVRGDQLAPRDGYYDLRVTGELWETFYIDHYSLLVVDHPPDVAVYTDERFAVPPVRPAVVPTAPPRPVARAVDDAGRDVTARIASLDEAYLDGFERGWFQGIARDHFVEVTLPDDAPGAGPLYLVAEGWLHPTDGSINVAASQSADARPMPIRVEVADGRGGFTTARADVGFPAGKHKIVLVDLDGVFRPGAPRIVRLRTNMEIYWDRIEWAAGRPDARLVTTRLPPATADLRYRGFSVMDKRDASSPQVPDYGRLADTTQRWRDLEGYYTRLGDVRPLLAEVDDRFVIMNAGDELALRFPEAPPPPAGWRRDFVLIGDGWIKDGDLNSGFSSTVLPLPTHETGDYTRPPTRLEDEPAYRKWPGDWQTFHTRYITPSRFRDVLRGRAGAR